jgi:hypothetical protein
MKKCLLLTAVVFLGTFTAAIAQVPSYVPTDGLVGWWPFNGNANDESGNGNDGTVNGATPEFDRFNQSNSCYQFNKIEGDYINGNLVNIEGTERTISIWASHNSGVNSGSSSSENEWFFAIGTSNPTELLIMGVYFYNETTISIGKFDDPLTLTNGEVSTNWRHYVVIQNNNSYSLYIDGILIDSFSNSSINWNNVNGEFFFGRQFLYDEFINARLDDIGIWNRALTEEEIQNLYIGCNVAPTTIAGNLSPATLTSTSYACNNNPGSTYQWTVTNGVITAGQGTSNITVLWGEEGTGTLSVVETNAEGCSGVTSTIDVTVVCATTATTIDGPLGPNALTSTTYTSNGVAGSSYQWTISNGVITSGQGTNSVTVLWAGTGLGTISVQETTNANCAGDVISLDVVVIPTSVEEQQDLSIALFPNPASNEVTLTASEGVRGKIYTLFSPTGQVVVTGTLSSRTTINLQGIATGIYTISVEGIVRKTLTVVQD